MPVSLFVESRGHYRQHLADPNHQCFGWLSEEQLDRNGLLAHVYWFMILLA